MKAYHVSGSYDLFPQHGILPTLTPEQHAVEVHKELFESIQVLDKPSKQKFLKKIAKALETLTITPEQRVTSEGETTDHANNALPIQRLPAIINPLNDHIPRRSQRLATDNAPILTVNTTPSSEQLPVHSPNIVSFQAVNYVTNKIYSDENTAWHPHAFLTSSPTNLTVRTDEDIEHMCAGIIHPTTGETITSYNKLIACPREVWTTAFGKEFGNLTQGDKKTGERGTNTMFVMTHTQIRNIPRDRTIIYGRVVVDYRPQKEDPNCVQITAGGNLIKDYPTKLTTGTADLTTSKMLWNSVLSTANAKFMGLDLKRFYLTAMLDRPEYMKMPLTLFPDHIRVQYNLDEHAINGFVYLELRGAIYGLPQEGALANKLLRKRLTPHRYYEVAHTPGLWPHVTRPISSTLVVDDFGVKYVGREHAEHLIQVLKEHYTMSIDWDGALYCGIQLNWDYDHRTLNISMPQYIHKVLQHFQHPKQPPPQDGPYKPYPKKYGAAAQDPIPADDSAPLDATGLKQIQQIVGALLYYARAVDNTILLSLSAIASEQAHPTQLTYKRCHHLLDYYASHPDDIVRFKASDMILNIHSDTSYLSETSACSRIAGHFFLGSVPIDKTPIKLNGAIYVSCGILKFVIASAAEAELGALFLNCKEGKMPRLILQELGHMQPPTPTHCDNETATGIDNDTVKKQQSRSMEMRFFWVTDQVNRHIFNIKWHPGQET
eukprot:CCRYP_015591-RA/>CCRYP_015591-RA protein AED:0.25 eAED:0.16 QI:0/0/0/1/1/1/2/0/716